METQDSPSRRKFISVMAAGSLGIYTSGIIPTIGNVWDEPDLPMGVELDGIRYGAKADKQGLIGGGNRYIHSITTGDYIINDLDTLLEALSNAKAGEVIFIPSGTIIDLTTYVYIEKLALEIPQGVILAGDRGHKDSEGALLTCDALDTPVMIKIAGSGVRITGLRIQGPNPKRYLEHHRRAFGPNGKGSSYYYKFPTSNGIVTEHSNLEVDNCEILAFGQAGIALRNGDGHHIHHNFIHQCQYNGLGYGISHDIASSVIEYNLFNENRHSIAGTGRPGCGYVARQNVELGISLSHCFDMHGGRDRKDGSDVAGTAIEIYNNTFWPPQSSVVIRGIPQEGCYVHHNWFPKHLNIKQAVRASERTTVKDNAYGEKPTVIV